MDCDKCRNKALKIAAEVRGERHTPIPFTLYVSGHTLNSSNAKKLLNLEDK